VGLSSGNAGLGSSKATFDPDLRLTAIYFRHWLPARDQLSQATVALAPAKGGFISAHTSASGVAQISNAIGAKRT
jgi:hypothetical protein